MTYEQVLAVLQPWDKRLRDLSAQQDLLSKSLDCANSPFFNAQYYVEEAYTHLVADTVGCDADLLSQWILEHSKDWPLVVGHGEEPMRKIRNVNELALFIFEGRE